MRRILFVDDEQSALNAHRKAMEKFRGRIDCMYAMGADAGLEQVRSAAIDVVVSDMHMPGIDGASFLGMVKEDHPELVRIMLCAQTEVEAIFTALPVSHQVLPKPCDPDTLCNVIERTCQLRELLTDSLRKRIGAVDQLPSVPAVYRELMSAMSRTDVSIQKIARIVEKDAAMAAKTLQLVNSACFSTSRTITKLEQAVAYLGMELIKNLSLTVHVFAALERTATRSGLSFDNEQEHSVVTARLAKRLMPGQRQSENAFTAALLHDIGNLVLAVCIPEKFKKAAMVCDASGRPAYEVEAEILGVTHAEVGAYLLGLWGLPYPIMEAVAFHHNPGAALERTFDIPSAVSVANALVEEAVAEKPFPLIDHLESLKLIDKLPRWREITQEELRVSSPPQTVARRR